MALTKVAPAGIGSTPGDGYRIGSSFLHSTGVELTNANASGIVTAAQFDGKLNIGIATFTDDVKFTGATSGRDVLWDKSENSLEFGDYTYAKFGADTDLTIWSNDTLSAINNKTGELRILSADDVKILKRNNDGTGHLGQLANFNIGGAVELFYNATKRIETSGIGATVTGQLDVGNVNSTGVITATSFVGSGANLTGISQVGGNTGVDFNDNVKARFGTGNDLEIFHNTNDDIINASGSGNLKLQKAGSTKIEVYGAGAQISGSLNITNALTVSNNVTANAFIGDGSNLTGITQTTINSNAANRIITGSGSANTLEGNSNFTYTGSVVTHNNPSGLAKLDVKGSVGGGALGASISVRNTNSANNGSGEFQFQDPGSNIFAKIAGINLTDGSNNGYMTFHTASATSGLVERLRITDDGRIDIKGDSGNDGFTLSNKYGQAGFFGGMYYNGSSWTRNAIGTRKGSGIYVNTNGHIVALTSAETSGTSATAVERFRLTQDGKVSMGLDAPTIGDATWYDDLVINNMSGGSGQPGGAGIQILSNSSSWGGLIFGDQTSNCQVGYLKYDHGSDKLVWGANSGERMALDTVTVSSTTSGVLGINDTSPAADALGLVVKNKGSQDSSLPVVLIQRDNNAGGGAGNEEIALKINMPYTYNNAGGCYGIKSYVVHNLNGLHYGGYFEARGSQYDAGGSGAGCYATIHKSDTNGPGYVPAFYAYARSTYNASSTGYAVGMRIKLNAYEPNRGILIHHELTNSNWTRMISFHKGSGANGTEVGSIKSSNNATQYNTSSDYRLKENVVDLTGAITRLKQLKPKRFNFKNDTSKTVDGFIAHEVEPVVPQAVSGTKDAVKIETIADPETGLTIMNEDGTPKTETKIDPQEVDYSKLSTLTIAALQEALAKIETLEAKVAALEGS